MDVDDVSTWLRLLEETFTVDGIVGANLLPIIRAEKEFRSHIEKFHGYLVLQDSFLSFFVETFELAELAFRQRPMPQWYGAVVMGYGTSFRRFRSAENLLLLGYPMDGYALLRDLKDRALVFGAAANGYTTYRRARGFTGEELNERADLDRTRKVRIKEERLIEGRMIGSKSGLSTQVREELRTWSDLFNLEMHGSILTFGDELLEWAERGESPLLPRRREQAIAMYLNRSHEIGWMLLRALPYLQAEPNGFGEAWANKFRVLDKSFRAAVGSLSELGKERIVDAIFALIDEKFAFTTEAYYWEADID